MKHARAQARPRHHDREETESIPEAAARHGVNPRTIRRYIALGTLPAYRLGPRLIRVKVIDTEELLTPIPASATAGGLK